MRIAVVTDRPEGVKAVLPALELLEHEQVGVPGTPPWPSQLDAEVVVVDAVGSLAGAAEACRWLSRTTERPVLVVTTAAQLVVLSPAWSFDDWVLDTADVAEVETRLRVCANRARAAQPRQSRAGAVIVDLEAHRAWAGKELLELSPKEFELLQALAAAPGRAFTRQELLRDVWGYRHPGGSRTVDVHIRRLRAKLGPRHESTIETVRGVGYRLAGPGTSRPPDAGAHP